MLDSKLAVRKTVLRSLEECLSNESNEIFNEVGIKHRNCFRVCERKTINQAQASFAAKFDELSSSVQLSVKKHLLYYVIAE